MVPGSIPGAPTKNTMPFIFIGIVMLIVSVMFLRKAIKGNDKEGIIGGTGLLIGSIILIIFFGIFYSSLVT